MRTTPTHYWPGWHRPPPPWFPPPSFKGQLVHFKLRSLLSFGYFSFVMLTSWTCLPDSWKYLKLSGCWLQKNALIICNGEINTIEVGAARPQSPHPEFRLRAAINARSKNQEHQERGDRDSTTSRRSQICRAHALIPLHPGVFEVGRWGPPCMKTTQFSCLINKFN